MTKEDYHAAWHRELGNAEHLVTITMAGYGSDEDAAIAYLDGFLARCPELGPVVSQNTEADTISVTFGVHARDQECALDLARVAWVAGASASGLEPTRVLRIEIEAVPVAESSEAALA